MDNVETLEELYRRKFDSIPESFYKEIGHFNVFRLEPMPDGRAKPVPFKRRDYYKVTFCIGGSRIHYADKVIGVEKQSLVFSNPFIPYKWEHTESVTGGYFCIFNQEFFYQYGSLEQYSLFQPSGTHVFELSDEQSDRVSEVYEKMFEEINSDYLHKYDVLRNLVFELLHFALKMQPSAKIDKHRVNASQRISALFLELLERQFPIDENHRNMQLRSASDFAEKLAVHVNHLNRSVKETTLKTTTQIIGERVLQEAKIMLKHSSWAVSEISDSLGFSELTHFNNFFRKHMNISPLKFRKS
jgi:AraC family transcriptional regulator, transcriptional activator of pobA